MTRNTFQTIGHRGAHIHSCFDSGREIITTTLTGNNEYGSVTDAKRAIGCRIAAHRRKSAGPQMWTYRGVDVFPADRNSMGIRWYARTSSGMLRSDTKQMMRFAILEQQS